MNVEEYVVEIKKIMKWEAILLKTRATWEQLFNIIEYNGKSKKFKTK